MCVFSVRGSVLVKGHTRLVKTFRLKKYLKFPVPFRLFFWAFCFLCRWCLLCWKSRAALGSDEVSCAFVFVRRKRFRCFRPVLLSRFVPFFAISYFAVCLLLFRLFGSLVIVKVMVRRFQLKTLMLCFKVCSKISGDEIYCIRYDYIYISALLPRSSFSLDLTYIFYFNGKCQNALQQRKDYWRWNLMYWLWLYLLKCIVASQFILPRLNFFSYLNCKCQSSLQQRKD